MVVRLHETWYSPGCSVGRAVVSRSARRLRRPRTTRPTNTTMLHDAQASQPNFFLPGVLNLRIWDS